MILSRKKDTDWENGREFENETFWASYSDLMAGLLMIFALTTMLTLLDIGKRLVEPTKVVQEWKDVVEEICHDTDLSTMNNVKVDCNTGALIISDENLRFGFSQSELVDEAKEVLRVAVPKYMDIIFRYPAFLKRIEVIEISGHTDRKDENKANPKFSRERAGQVLSFLLSEPSMAPHADFFAKKAITSGYADTRFPPSSICIEDMCAAARRVEINVRLNDADVLRDFLRILKQIIGET